MMRMSRWRRRGAVIHGFQRNKHRPAVLELEPRRLLSAYVVNDSSDLPLDPAIGPGETANGTITLRSAIQQVDIDGTGSIGFASSMTITTSGLPTITASGVTIDGGTLGSVVVEGNGAAASGLILAGNDAAITGLEITGFGHDGIDVGATCATIGGTAAGAGNAVFGNTGAGLSLGSFGGSALVQGNFIGTDPAGESGVGNKGDGIYIDSAGNTIGGASAAARNVISGNAGDGVDIAGTIATGNVVASDFIGTSPAGSAALANYDGVVIDGGASDNVIGASGGKGGPNVVSGNTTNGIFITGAGTSGNLVAGSDIGTNAAGTASIANTRSGILLDNSSTDTTVGLPGAGNLISGNGGRGIAAFDVTGTIIQANLIGTNAAGTAVIPGDYVNGVEIDNGSATIGGTTPGTANVISIGPGGTDGPDSGPGYAGGYDEQPSGITLNWIAEPATVTAALIEGNLIGTDITGTVALGNPAGITISSAAAATIGGTAAGAGNLIADSQQDGIVLDYIGSSDNLIQGNTIVDNGLQTSTGSWAGIRIFNEPSATNSASTGNTIGGTTAGAGNIIADNAGPGVAIDGPYATGNVVEGNVIGTNAGGTLAEGNGMGVDIEGAPSNLVEDNVIAASAGPGVLINNTVTTINGFTAAPGRPATSSRAIRSARQPTARRRWATPATGCRSRAAQPAIRSAARSPARPISSPTTAEAVSAWASARATRPWATQSARTRSSRTAARASS